MQKRPGVGGRDADDVMEADLSRPDLSGSLLFGSLIMVVSGFFPWVTIGGTTLSGFDSHTAALWMAVFAAVAALLAWRVRDDRISKKSKTWISSAGWFGLGIGGIGYAIPEQLYDIGGTEIAFYFVEVEVTGEAGLLVAAIGGLTLIVSTARMRAEDDTSSARDRVRDVGQPVERSAGSADTKTCPRCAESVKAAANVCRFCGYEFPVPEVPSPPAPQLAQGEVVTDIRVHAFGVEWGKTESGRVVYREMGAPEWVAYDARSTALVPPTGYARQ